jgi:hypothetical protein
VEGTAEEQMATKVKARTKFSSFEYIGAYADPLFEPIRLYGAVDAVYRALKPWNVLTQDVKYKGGINTPFDPIVSIELAKAQYTINLGLGGFGFKGNAVDWSQAPVIIEIVQSTAKALEGALKAVTAEHTLTIIMQLATEGKSIKEITIPFAAPLGYPTNEIDFFGFMLHTTDDGLFYVDKSAADPNDLFVRIVKKFKGKLEMEDMSKQMYNAEFGLADTLGIEIE